MVVISRLVNGLACARPLSILKAAAGEIAATSAAGELVDLGSGASDKARILLGAMAAGGTLRRYIPLDVSETAVRGAAAELVSEFAGLRVHGVIGDFERHLDCVPRHDRTPRLVALLGGTIGNFPPGSRRVLLRKISDLLAPGDHLLLGADLVKDPHVIEAAYNDSKGVTAEFNRNVLRVLNRDLRADFPVDNFDHVAFFDRRHEWIEMRLRARRACSVAIPEVGLRVDFGAGEELRTEISAKFTRSRLQRDLAAAGLALKAWFVDDDDRFALSLAAPERTEGGLEPNGEWTGRIRHVRRSLPFLRRRAARQQPDLAPRETLR